MARLNIYNLRLNNEEMIKLKAYAQSKQIAPSEVLREYIKKLPNVKDS